MKESFNKISENLGIITIILFSYYSVVVYFLMGIRAYLIFCLPILISLTLLRILKRKKGRKNKNAKR